MKTKFLYSLAGAVLAGVSLSTQAADFNYNFV